VTAADDVLPSRIVAARLVLSADGWPLWEGRGGVEEAAWRRGDGHRCLAAVVVGAGALAAPGPAPSAAVLHAIARRTNSTTHCRLLLALFLPSRSPRSLSLSRSLVPPTLLSSPHPTPTAVAASSLLPAAVRT